MLLEKTENLLEFSVKQLVILASSIFWGQAMLKTKMVCEKRNINVVCSKIRYFNIQKALCKPNSYVIPFKR